MTDVGTLVADLITAGVPAELVGRVAKALSEREVVVVHDKDEAAERRRAADRERKRAVRGIPQTTADSADIAETSGNPLPPCPPSFPPDPLTTPLNPPIPNPTDGAGAKSRSTGPPGRGKRLPPDWRPTDDDVTAARAEGLTDEQIRREADRFRDYWTAKSGPGGVKLDWPATWRNWVRRAVDDGRGGVAGGYRGGGAAVRPDGGRRQPDSKLAEYAAFARDHPD